MLMRIEKLAYELVFMQLKLKANDELQKKEESLLRVKVPPFPLFYMLIQYDTLDIIDKTSKLLGFFDRYDIFIEHSGNFFSLFFDRSQA